MNAGLRCPGTDLPLLVASEEGVRTLPFPVLHVFICFSLANMSVSILQRDAGTRVSSAAGEEKTSPFYYYQLTTQTPPIVFSSHTMASLYHTVCTTRLFAFPNQRMIQQAKPACSMNASHHVTPR